MKILHLDTNNKWVSVERRYYEDESHLQNLLADDVNTLPFAEIGYQTPFVTIGKEVSLANGSLDLLAVSPQGHIALIETKLEKNPEAKRTVVGQILGYAAYLWNQSYDDIEQIFKKFLIQQKITFDGSLIDYIKEKVPDCELTEADFKEGIEKRLRLGSFSLLIVVDHSNQELIDIANYLNERTGQEIDFYVIEMELVGDKQEKFLIPRLTNPPRKNIAFSEKTKTNDNYGRTPIGKEDFISRLSDPGKKLALTLLEKFEDSPGISIAWRKGGFSILKQIPLSLVKNENYQPSFSFFFFKAGKDQISRNDDRLGFEYPEMSFDLFQNIRPIVSEFVEYYRSIAGFDDTKKIIEDLSVFSEQVTAKFMDLIEQTANKL